MAQLIKINAMKGNNISEYELEYKQISEKLESLELMKIQALNVRKKTGEVGSGVEQINHFIKKSPYILTEYDDVFSETTNRKHCC